MYISHVRKPFRPCDWSSRIKMLVFILHLCFFRQRSADFFICKNSRQWLFLSFCGTNFECSKFDDGQDFKFCNLWVFWPPVVMKMIFKILVFSILGFVLSR